MNFYFRGLNQTLNCLFNVMWHCIKHVCHAPSLHPGCDRHLKTIDVPQENPWPGLLNSVEDFTQEITLKEYVIQNGNLTIIVYKRYEKTKELTLSVYEACKL